MKTFRYKFSKTIITLITVSLLLCVFSIALSVRRLTYFASSGFFNKASTLIMVIVSGALFAVLVSLLISSVYKIEKEKLIIRFGVVKSYIKLSDIVSISLYEKTEKLVLFFGEGKYTVIVVNRKWYDEFIGAMLAANPKIIYERTDIDKLPN